MRTENKKRWRAEEVDLDDFLAQSKSVGVVSSVVCITAMVAGVMSVFIGGV